MDTTERTCDEMHLEMKDAQSHTTRARTKPKPAVVIGKQPAGLIECFTRLHNFPKQQALPLKINMVLAWLYSCRRYGKPRTIHTAWPVV